MTEIQGQPSRFIPLEEAGPYRTDLIPDVLIAGVDLPEAGYGKAPQWHGYILENKIFYNFENTAWKQYTPGEHYFNRFEIEHISELGFNCVRVLYSLSYLSPTDLTTVDESELEQLDELLSWCLENNLHLMLSITGMPGQAGGDCDTENVGRNDAVLTDPSIRESYNRLMELLARRYASIPAKALSFELLAEPSCQDMDTYVSVLSDTAKAMWQYDDSKILIANDVGIVPTALAEIGCCLSHHTHIYPINASILADQFHILYTPSWPMVCGPGLIMNDQFLRFQSENGFHDGKLQLYYTYYNQEPELYADGVKIAWDNATGQTLVYESGVWYAAIPEGTKEIHLKCQETGLAAVIIDQGDQHTVLPGLIYTGDMPADWTEPGYSYLVTDDGSIRGLDDFSQNLSSWGHLYDTVIQPFVQCAEENNVTYIMTEIGTDTQSLSPEEYIAYHSELLEVLEEHGIGWMYNCIHNILAPRDIMWINSDLGFTMEPISGTPYFENREITDLLTHYARLANS